MAQQEGAQTGSLNSGWRKCGCGRWLWNHHSCWCEKGSRQQHGNSVQANGMEVDSAANEESELRDQLATARTIVSLLRSRPHSEEDLHGWESKVAALEEQVDRYKPVALRLKGALDRAETCRRRVEKLSDEVGEVEDRMDMLQGQLREAECKMAAADDDERRAGHEDDIRPNVLGSPGSGAE